MQGIKGGCQHDWPLSVYPFLSWGGQTADPVGVKRPALAKFKQTKTAHGANHTHKHIIQNSHTYTQLHKAVIFVPLRSISLSNSAPPLWHVRSHNGLWHQSPNDHNDISLRTLSRHNRPLFDSECQLFFCLISPTKQCYRSTNWAWTIAHKGGTDLVFPALLPTETHPGQCAVKVNWPHAGGFNVARLLIC